MAFQTMWFDTFIPKEIVDLIERDCRDYEDSALVAQVRSGVNLNTRDSKTSWIPQSHWIGGFCMSYVLKANRDNYQYDITDIDGGEMQYTIYGPGQYYNWHIDAGIDSLEEGCVRKLSFILQLSEPDEYAGGEVQLLNEQDKMYILPKRRGTFCVFDSRTKHRVRPIESGTRKSLVGWVNGPRWK